MLKSKLLIITVFISFLYVVKCHYKTNEAQMTVPELVSYHGYPVEVHDVTTQDGYILGIHRIPYSPKNRFKNGTKPVVFLQHGIIASSSDWIIPGPGKGLAYLLSDLGYDVWMGNSRGNRYSRRHIHYNPEGKNFWKFSFHEMGLYDTPAIIDYIIKITDQKKLFYIGHSQGTTSFFVMCSTRPEYNHKIRAMFALAPTAYMSHLKNPILKLVAFTEGLLQIILKLLRIHEFLPENRLISRIGEALCKPYVHTQELCSNTIFFICGFSEANLNKTLLPIIAGHTPAGSSIKQFFHFSQEINSGKFARYDYGVVQNLLKYKQLSPPDYDLGKVTAPVILFYSHNDWLVGEKDVDRLYSELSNPIAKFVVEDRNFNHLDYLWGTNAREMVYNNLFKLMSQF